MKTSKSHIEDMHAKLADISNKESLLISALGEALSLADKKLLDDVRSLTIEHETRRGLILSELQNLAARIGAFPIGDDSDDTIERQGHLDLPYYDTGEAPPCEHDRDGMGHDHKAAAPDLRSPPPPGPARHGNFGDADGATLDAPARGGDWRP